MFPMSPWQCPFHLITGLPCPGCGTIRALQHLLKGDVQQALYTNPVGLIAALLIAVCVVVMAIDFSFGTNILDRYCYTYWENAVRRYPLLKPLLIACVCVVAAANMYWNYKKGL